MGAGPTGLSLALVLRHFGIKLRIVDRAARPSAVSKALAVWSGSLEALHGLGVVDQFVAAGARLNFLSIGHGSRELARMAVGDGIDSPYPYPLLLPQSRTEEILGARLAALGGEIERGVDMMGLVQDEDGVTAELRHDQDRTERVRARYVVGCDGARSFMRQALNIAFEGYTEPQTFLLGDVRIDGGDLDHRSIHLRWNNGGMVALFPFESDVWRVFSVRDDIGDAPATLSELQAHVDRHGPGGLRLRDPTWLSTFRINERLAARYRVGRCFLAGDAAHIHSPAGGQGMNTGIQDAVNLGWKLAYVLQRAGDPELLLDSYEAERRPIAREVIKGAAQKLHLSLAASPLALLMKDIAVNVFANRAAVQKKLQIELSETEIAYRHGLLVELGAPPRRPRRTDVGTRARDATFIDGAGQPQALWSRLSGLRHTLLLFEADGPAIGTNGLAAAYGDRLNLVRLDARADSEGKARRRYRLDGTGWVLIRPDQVVAARGTGPDLSAATRYLDSVARIGAAGAGVRLGRAAASADRS